MNQSTRLETVGEVIEAFGGPKAMAATLGGTGHRYSNYKKRGYFPPNLHMPIYIACMKRGLRLKAELVGANADDLAQIEALIQMRCGGVGRAPHIAAE